MRIWVQKSALIQRRTSRLNFGHFIDWKLGVQVGPESLNSGSRSRPGSTGTAARWTRRGPAGWASSPAAAAPATPRPFRACPRQGCKIRLASDRIIRIVDIRSRFKFCQKLGNLLESIRNSAFLGLLIICNFVLVFICFEYWNILRNPEKISSKSV